ncbi:MAG TPA: ABC transporter permease [Gemmatimonadaceae bacterium]|nr:ABC transporter permease [Gemmatimonadaceae bacterium]
MLRYLARRLGQAAVIVAIVATITFALIHLAPGDPFSEILDNPNVSEKVRVTLRAQYGLDRPLAEQFVRYVNALAHGELGWSFSHDRPVSEVLSNALPNTLLLMSVALVGSFVLGILVALIQVARKGTAVDHTISAVTLFFFSMPDFWLGILALLAFTYWLPIFPVGGAVDPVMHEFLGLGGRIIDRLRHLMLPALTLTVLASASVARFQRAALLDVLPADYIRTARLKGLTERQVLRRHALRNALLPIITLIGLSFPALLTGAFFIEKIFAWPGMGYAVVTAIGRRDYALVVGGVIIGSIMVTLGSLLADLLYAWADPRLRAH